ncbi:protein of unknown function [Pseudomonas sp. JV241A]|nr:protein of unknown function [Pseudomonas sp. JV241A]
MSGVSTQCLGCRREIRSKRLTRIRGEMLYMRFDSGTDHTSLRPYVVRAWAPVVVSLLILLSISGLALHSMPRSQAHKRYASRRPADGVVTIWDGWAASVEAESMAYLVPDLPRFQKFRLISVEFSGRCLAEYRV